MNTKQRIIFILFQQLTENVTGSKLHLRLPLPSQKSLILKFSSIAKTVYLTLLLEQWPG